MNEEKTKKNDNKIVLIICLILGAFIWLKIIIPIVLLFGLVFMTMLEPADTRIGIGKYDKDYYIEKYGGDLDSKLLIFPDDKGILDEAEFESSFKTNILSTDGNIILKVKYDYETFESEIERIGSLELTIYDSCKENAKEYINRIIYDKESYYLPAYITIDGFANTYEYALIDDDRLEIVYLYLSYPETNNIKYKDYLKKDTREYDSGNTLSRFSIYNHSFDDVNDDITVFMEFDDCQ